MPHRSLARVLALLALVAAAGAVVLVIATSDAVKGGDDGATETSSTATKRKSAPASTRTGATTPTRSRTPSVYVVKPGDILSTIAEKTGVSVERILELNPDIDPQALVTGQRIKLKP